MVARNSQSMTKSGAFAKNEAIALPPSTKSAALW